MRATFLLFVSTMSAGSVCSPIMNSCSAGELPPSEVATEEQRLKGKGEVTALSYSMNGTFLASVEFSSATIWKLGVPAVSYQRVKEFDHFVHPRVTFDPKTDNLLIGNKYIVTEMELSEESRKENPGHPLFREITGRSEEYPFSWECYSIAFSRGGQSSAIGFSRYNERVIKHDFTEGPRVFPPGVIVRSDGAKMDLDERLLKLAKENGLRSIAFDSDGRFLAIGGRVPGREFDGGFVVLAEIVDDKVVQRFGPVFYKRDSVNCISYSRDNRFIALGTETTASSRPSTDSNAPGHVIVLDRKNLEPKSKLDCCPSSVEAISFSSDSSMLFAGGNDKEIHVFSTKDWDSITRLTGHSGNVNDIQLSPDGKQLASASDDKSIILWKPKK